MTDNELFEIIERDWVNYYGKCESRDEIPWQAEGMMGKLVTYKGDLPVGGLAFDGMPVMIDKFRKFHITNDERFARDMMFKVLSSLQLFIMVEPLYRNQVTSSGKKITQTILAAALGFSIDQYKKQRGKAKQHLIFHAREGMKQERRKRELKEGAA